MTIVNSMVKPVIKNYKKLSQSAQAQRQVAQRASQMYGLNKTKAAIAKGKASITGALTPVVDKIISASDSFGIVAKTLGTMKRKGIKKAKPDIKEAVKEITGVNDIKAATQSGGAVKGAMESGKAATRLATTLGFFVAGNFVPLPGASIIGWVAGEKLANFLLGKPFTKQAKNLIK